MNINTLSIQEASVRAILNRVGTVLIVVGVLDIAYMIYFFAIGGTQYASSFNILAVIAGIFLRKGSLRAVKFIGFFARIFFVGVVIGILILPFLYPPALIKTFFLVSPTSMVVLYLTLAVTTVVLLWWVDRNLHSQVVIAVLRDAGLYKKWPRILLRLRVCFLFMTAVGVVLVSMFYYINQTDVAAKARSMAQEQLGQDYNYHISSLSISTRSGHRRINATVIAYSDMAIEILNVSWVD